MLKRKKFLTGNIEFVSGQRKTKKSRYNIAKCIK